jgi:chromosome condensin MukBEF complex kleisin-like MukF subunit
VKSTARKLVPGGTDNPPQPTGFAAYRATVNVEKMKADAEIAWLPEKPSLNIWIGEDRHVMSYTIAAGKSFNMVLSHVDPTSLSTCLLNGKLWHFADGPAQRLRDLSMRPEAEGVSFSWRANQWGDPVTQ